MSDHTAYEVWCRTDSACTERWNGDDWHQPWRRGARKAAVDLAKAHHDTTGHHTEVARLVCTVVECLWAPPAGAP